LPQRYEVGVKRKHAFGRAQRKDACIPAFEKAMLKKLSERSDSKKICLSDAFGGTSYFLAAKRR